MAAIRTHKMDAEKTKQMMLRLGIMDFSRTAKHDGESIYFPLTKGAESAAKKIGLEVTSARLEENENRKRLKDSLEGELTASERKSLNRSFDIVGNIAILDIPPELKGKEKIIAKALMERHSSLKTVLSKSDIHKGEFRTQKMRYVAGERTKETIHKENGALLKLNVEEVYFSPRSSTERKRIAGLVKKGERVLVMFSGCGPYMMVIGKNTKADEIIGIEKNRVAHDYAVENIRLNKFDTISNGRVKGEGIVKGDRRVKALCGDVREEVPKLKGTFDRILMPLPKDADMFIDTALSKAKKGTMLHIYLFLHEDEFDEAKKRVESIGKACGARIKVKEIVRCGQYSPKTYRTCVDAVVM